MPDVLLAYAIAALLVAIVFVVAFLLRSALARARFLNLVGLVIVAIALLEKAGWSARPWTLGSPAAVFNDLLFRIFFLVGFGLIFCAQLSVKR
ncbi:MAG TPA: hypothetical protein VME17_26450 [Bryobacteraceae bacterium]|nr:hypothetical protein [Bryobacteraceae bacterium]